MVSMLRRASELEERWVKLRVTKEKVDGGCESSILITVEFAKGHKDPLSRVQKTYNLTST